MSSKKELSKPKNLPLTSGESSSTPAEEPEKEQKATLPEIPVEKKGAGKTRRVEKYGTRRRVWNGTAEKTRGGLRKEDLVRNNRGRIVSAKRHTTMKQRHGSS